MKNKKKKPQLGNRDQLGQFHLLTGVRSSPIRAVHCSYFFFLRSLRKTFAPFLRDLLALGFLTNSLA